MKMLERAARAACEVDCGAWDDESPDSRTFYVELAAATIRAIREPDEEVIEAMVTAAAASGAESVQEMARTIWQAGIDAMMEERK